MSALSVAAGESRHSEVSQVEGNRPKSDDGSSPGDLPLPHFQRLIKAKVFHPPHKRTYPRDLFAQDMKTHPVHRPGHKTADLRMVRRSNPDKEILIFTSGQIIMKDAKNREDPAGCAVIYMPKSDGSGKHTECIGFRLEERGPNGEFFNPKSMRADLRAVVAALEFKLWSSEGWEKVTIATDSNYVTDGITRHVEMWREKGWLGGTSHRGKKVKNLDLWTRALDLINEQALNGCEISFWLIKAAQNHQAHMVARRMAKEGERSEEYRAFGDVGSAA